MYHRSSNFLPPVAGEGREIHVLLSSVAVMEGHRTAGVVVYWISTILTRKLFQDDSLWGAEKQSTQSTIERGCMPYIPALRTGRC